MARSSRSNDWGFPRWRSYGSSREAIEVRLCDRYGCTQAGTCPAPKAPNKPDRWLFCVGHAAEYNRGWDYFQGLSAEEAAAREASETQDNGGFNQAKYYGWGGPGDGSRTREEMRALDILEVDSDAEFDAIKAAHRRLAKANHPDLAPDDKEAAIRFQAIQTAYEILRQSEERRVAVENPF